MATIQKTLTCIVCPRGCTLTVTMDFEAENPVVSVQGQGCQRGVGYAIASLSKGYVLLATSDSVLLTLKPFEVTSIPRVEPFLSPTAAYAALVFAT